VLAKLLCMVDTEVLLMFNRIKRFCVVAGYLSERVFITYYDVAIDATLTPLDILWAALRHRGEYDGYDNIEVLVSELRKKFKVLLTVFDKAEKWYRECTAPDEEIHTSKQAIGQLYSLCCQLGSTVILCEVLQNYSIWLSREGLRKPPRPWETLIMII
jgi:hypothetical protein